MNLLSSSINLFYYSKESLRADGLLLLSDSDETKTKREKEVEYILIYLRRTFALNLMSSSIMGVATICWNISLVEALALGHIPFIIRHLSSIWSSLPLSALPSSSLLSSSALKSASTDKKKEKRKKTKRASSLRIDDTQREGQGLGQRYEQQEGRSCAVPESESIALIQQFERYHNFSYWCLWCCWNPVPMSTFYFALAQGMMSLYWIFEIEQKLKGETRTDDEHDYSRITGRYRLSTILRKMNKSIGYAMLSTAIFVMAVTLVDEPIQRAWGYSRLPFLILLLEEKEDPRESRTDDGSNVKPVHEDRTIASLMAATYVLSAF